MYTTFVVRGDATFTATTASQTLGAFLCGPADLVEKAVGIFATKPGAAWAEVAIASADRRGNYAVTGEHCAEHVNLVEVVCSERGARPGRELAEKVAAFLGWEVVVDGPLG